LNLLNLASILLILNYDCLLIVNLYAIEKNMTD
jgi:hypothetical protein